MSTTFRFRAICVRVIDGDTQVYTVDQGLRVHQDVIIRLAGIDCAEVRGPKASKAGVDATHAAAAWIANNLGMAPHNVVPWPLVLETQKDPDNWGRYVGTVYVSDPMDEPTVSLNQYLLDTGHAKEWKRG